MRRLVPVLLAMTATLLVAAPAHADYHLMKVSEVALSAGVDSPVQFVELKDDFPEGFPVTNAPYKIVVFDGSGTRVDAVDVTDGLRGYQKTEPYLVSTAGGDQPLTVTLPSVGQVCFTNGPDETKLHCLAYGCPANPFSVAQSGQAPAPGQSLQRLGPGSLMLGTPTPDAANNATSPADCAGGGGGGGAPGGGETDITKPGVAVASRARQDVDRLRLSLTLTEDAIVTVGGSVSVPGASKVFRLKAVKRDIHANVRTVVKVKLSKKAKRAVKRAIARGRKIKARLTIAATDAAGNKRTARKTVRLTD